MSISLNRGLLRAKSEAREGKTGTGKSSNNGDDGTGIIKFGETRHALSLTQCYLLQRNISSKADTPPLKGRRGMFTPADHTHCYSSKGVFLSTAG
jgi:hypothetical protein